MRFSPGTLQSPSPCIRLTVFFPRGTPGDESQDTGYNFTNARRRSNSSNHGRAINDFKTKFEAVETDPVFEEEIHGALKEEMDELTHEKSESADSASMASVDDEELAKK